MKNENYEKQKLKFQLVIENLFLRFTSGIITIFMLYVDCDTAKGKRMES